MQQGLAVYAFQFEVANNFFRFCQLSKVFREVLKFWFSVRRPDGSMRGRDMSRLCELSSIVLRKSLMSGRAE